MICPQLAELQILRYELQINRTPLNQSAFSDFAWYMISHENLSFLCRNFENLLK